MFTLILPQLLAIQRPFINALMTIIHSTRLFCVYEITDPPPTSSTTFSKTNGEIKNKIIKINFKQFSLHVTGDI